MCDFPFIVIAILLINHIRGRNSSSRYRDLCKRGNTIGTNRRLHVINRSVYDQIAPGCFGLHPCTDVRQLYTRPFSAVVSEPNRSYARLDVTNLTRCPKKKRLRGQEAFMLQWKI